MTPLRRAVRRMALTPRGEYVLILMPGAEPMIEVREKGRHAGFGVTVADLYFLLAKRYADAAIEARRKRRADVA